MNNEKKVIETVEPKQEAAAKTTPAEEAGRARLREMVRLKAMRYGERAEWYRDMGYDRLAEQEIERKRFLFDIVEYIDECPTLFAAYEFLSSEATSLHGEHCWALNLGLARELSALDLWKIKFLHRLLLHMDIEGKEDVDRALAFVEYLEVSEKEGGFWL